jgi:hypothetical protein
MKLEDIKPPPGFRPLRLAGRDVPHFVLEPTLDCNARCRRCYRVVRGYSKTAQAVRAEVDLALSKRNLETISILGGEPTMHSELPEIVAYVKAKQLTCQILTNGILLQDGPLLDRLIRAGLDRIVLHADTGQGRSETELRQFTHRLARRFEQRKLPFGMSLTIYRDNAGSIPDLVRELGRYRYFDGVLATLAADFARCSRRDSDASDQPTLLGEYRALRDRLGVEPATYVPSNLSDDELRWLIYFYFLNVETGETFGISSLVSRGYRRIHRALAGRHPFAAPLRPRWLVPAFFALSCIELLTDPKRWKSWRRLVKKSSWLGSLRLHYVVLQRGPDWNERAGSVEMCFHCPDATLRHGKLTPVCLADLMSPLHDGERDSELERMVHAHLGEM